MGTSISAGITPACAGKSFFTGLEHLSDGDHPRMRGEKFSPNPEAYKTKGSPPHARGKAVVAKKPCALPGITPACAGKRLRKH